MIELPKLENASIHWVSLPSGAGRSSSTVGTPLLVTLPRLRPPATLCNTILCIFPSLIPIVDGQKYILHDIFACCHYTIYNCFLFSVCLNTSILRSFDFSAVPINNQTKYMRDRQCLCLHLHANWLFKFQRNGSTQKERDSKVALHPWKVLVGLD